MGIANVSTIKLWSIAVQHEASYSLYSETKLLGKFRLLYICQELDKNVQLSRITANQSN